jgi:hypothetical protein
MSNQTPRILQQQEPNEPQDGKPGAREEPMGEGSYKGTHDYNQRQAEYMKTHDVRKDAEAAQPRSEEEAREMKQAEEEGKSHSKGEK